MSGGRTATVLVVEDQPLLLLDSVDLVEAAGLSAYGVRDAGAAIAALGGDPGIRIVLTGMSLGGSRDGLTLAATVRDRWPAVSVIVMSGHRPPPFDLLPGVRFLPRPFGEAELREALGEPVG